MKTKLIKSLNELLFKNLSDLKLKAVTKDSSLTDLYVITQILDKEFHLNIEKDRYGFVSDAYEIVKDLIDLENGKDIRDLCSDVAYDVQNDLKKLEVRFNNNFETSDITTQVMDLLSVLSKESYIVGGCVRDVCRGINPKDVDFCTDTDMNVLVKEFKNKGFKCDEVGLQFLVLVVSKDGESFEIANFRKDKNNEGGEKGSISEDSLRRDFGVNSCYIRISDGRLFDPNGAFVDDIINNTLRFVGNPTDRLEEDSLRAFRFYRFISKGFTPDKKSLQAVRQHFDKCVKETTPERIRMEIEKMVGV